MLLLEGGYSLQGLSEGVAESIGALIGEHPHHPNQSGLIEPLQAVADCIARLQKFHGLSQAG